MKFSGAESESTVPECGKKKGNFCAGFTKSIEQVQLKLGISMSEEKKHDARAKLLFC